MRAALQCSFAGLLGGLATSLGLSPANQRGVCYFFCATAACAYRDFPIAAAGFSRRSAPPRGRPSAPRARPLVGFVLDEVRRDDLAAGFAEALGAVAERKVAERSHEERGRVIVGGGKVALLAERVGVLEDNGIPIADTSVELSLSFPT